MRIRGMSYHTAWAGAVSREATSTLPWPPRITRSSYWATGLGSGRTTTVSAMGMISVIGRSAASA
jgi:hypothetical protein